MKKRLIQKIEHWRNQPEHTRVRIATRLTWITGIALIGIWLVLLLPFQLYISRDHVPQPAIQGVTTSENSTPTPTVNPFITQ